MGMDCEGLLMYGYTDHDGEPGEPSEKWQAAVDFSDDNYIAFTDLEKKHGVTIRHTGGYSYPKITIVLQQPRYRAEWSQTKAINPEELAAVATPENTARLRAFAAELGLDLSDQEPSWFLGSSYG